MGIAVLIVLLCGGALLHSLADEADPTRFLVISIPAYSGSDPGIQEIINGYIKFELQRARLLVEADANVPEGLREEAAAIDELRVREVLLNRGKEAGADFLVACIFDRIANTIQMTFSLYDVSRGQLMATAVRERKQTLLVEWSIADVIAGFLAEIGDRLVFVDETVIAGQEPEPVGEPEPENVPDREPEEPPRPYLDDVSRRFELVGGMAPYVLVGRTGDYGRLGLNTSISVGYRFIGDRSQLILGMSTGVCSFTAESAASRSRIVLVPLSAQVSLRTTPTHLGFLVHLAGGPAAFLFNQDQGGYQFKLVPYATTGLGVEIPILSQLGLLIDLSFSVYYESSQPVMGYAPAASVYYRF
jgi:hypothetical protein